MKTRSRYGAIPLLTSNVTSLSFLWFFRSSAIFASFSFASPRWQPQSNRGCPFPARVAAPLSDPFWTTVVAGIALCRALRRAPLSWCITTTRAECYIPTCTLCCTPAPFSFRLVRGALTPRQRQILLAAVAIRAWIDKQATPTRVVAWPGPALRCRGSPPAW